MGTLMKKIQCQLTACVRTPPASSPIDPPLETMKVYTLIAIARSDGFGNSVTSRARTAAEATAPPSPWMNRATIRSTWLSARPHATEAAVNTTRPVRNIRLRPRRSPSRPARSRKLTNAIM